MSHSQGTFHTSRRHAPLGRNLVSDQSVSPWARLPRPGIHARLATQMIASFDLPLFDAQARDLQAEHLQR